MVGRLCVLTLLGDFDCSDVAVNSPVSARPADDKVNARLAVFRGQEEYLLALEVAISPMLLISFFLIGPFPPGFLNRKEDPSPIALNYHCGYIVEAVQVWGVAVMTAAPSPKVTRIAPRGRSVKLASHI